MATTNGGWISVRTIRGRFEDPVLIDSLSTTESRSEHLLHDSLENLEKKANSCHSNSPLNDVEAVVKERPYCRQNSDDRLTRRRDSYELRLKGNEHKFPPRRLQSDEGPCINSEPAIQSRKLHARKGGYHHRYKDPELLAWKSLQNVNAHPGKIIDSPLNRDQVSSTSSDGSEEIDSLGRKQGHDICVKVNKIRESISPVVLRRKSNYDVTPEDKNRRMRQERKFLEHNSSPVLDFRERKLAFEKAVGALDERFKSLTKSTLKNKSVARKMRPDEFTNNFPPEASKCTFTKTSSESASANSSFEAEESFRDGSSYQGHSRTNRFRRLRPTSSSTGSSKSSKNSSPKILKDRRKDVIDSYSEKEVDSTESLESRIESPITHSNETELNLHHHEKVKQIDRSDTEDEEIPVFCVQDYVRGRERSRKESPGRSRSEGAELKARNRHGLDTKVFECERDSHRKVAKSSNDINLNENDLCSKLAFKDKQRMLEEVMNTENVLNGVKYSRARSSSPRKGAKVFRKMSFTSKSDKDRQNKIARGRLSMNHLMPKKQLDTVDNSADISGKKSFSKFIPKITPFAPALRFPLASNEKPKLDMRDSHTSNSDNIRKKKSSVVLRRNLFGRDETHFSSDVGEVKNEVNEVTYFEKKESDETGNRKSLPEKDFIQMQPVLRGSHRRNKSYPNDLIVASVVSSSDIMENGDSNVKKPLTPSQLYNSKRSRKYSDLSNDFSGDTFNYSSLPITSCTPVRPPRRRNSEFPRKKSKAPQPPSQIQLIKSDEESSIREPILRHCSRSESSPVSTASSNPSCETTTCGDSTTEAHLLTTASYSLLNVSNSSASDKNCTDDVNARIPVPVIFPGGVNAKYSEPLSSKHKLLNSIPLQVSDISFPDASKSLSDRCFPKTVSLGPCSYQGTSLPLFNTGQSLSTTKPSCSPTEQTPFNTVALSSSKSATPDNSFGPSPLTNFLNMDITTKEKSKNPSTILKASVNLPPGPPPQKPPRTFAHDIHSSESRHDGPVSDQTMSALSSSALKEPKIAEPLISPSPLYSVVNKKGATPKLPSTINSSSKPLIAPKPPNIKSLFKNKRLSLAEPSLNNSTRDNDFQNSDLKTFSQLRYSFRKNPPDVPPPEPPSNPKPRLQDPGRSDAAEPGSECNHYSEAFIGTNEGKLNRQRSISDETLCSSSGYHRVAVGTPEHIYASPDLHSASRRAGSGGELHYLCSDLVQGRRGSSEHPDRRVNGSSSNLISAWKHEFRQSYRLMQSKIKKSVNR